MVADIPESIGCSRATENNGKSYVLGISYNVPPFRAHDVLASSQSLIYEAICSDRTCRENLKGRYLLAGKDRVTTPLQLITWEFPPILVKPSTVFPSS